MCNFSFYRSVFKSLLLHNAAIYGKTLIQSNLCLRQPLYRNSLSILATTLSQWIIFCINDPEIKDHLWTKTIFLSYPGWSLNTGWTVFVSSFQEFCNFDDYNWDWTLQHVSSKCIPNQVRVLKMKATRVFHMGEW